MQAMCARLIECFGGGRCHVVKRAIFDLFHSYNAGHRQLLTRPQQVGRSVGLIDYSSIEDTIWDTCRFRVLI